MAISVRRASSLGKRARLRRIAFEDVESLLVLHSTRAAGDARAPCARPPSRACPRRRVPRRLAPRVSALLPGERQARTAKAAVARAAVSRASAVRLASSVSPAPLPGTKAASVPPRTTRRRTRDERGSRKRGSNAVRTRRCLSVVMTRKTRVKTRMKNHATPRVFRRLSTSTTRRARGFCAGSRSSGSCSGTSRFPRTRCSWRLP